MHKAMKPEPVVGRICLGTFSKGRVMSREDELAMIRQHVSIIAERTARLIEVVSIKTRAGHSTALVEEQIALLESMMWRLHRHGARLKAETKAPGIVGQAPPSQLSA